LKGKKKTHEKFKLQKLTYKNNQIK